jgi:hypothetical protein
MGTPIRIRVTVAINNFDYSGILNQEAQTLDDQGRLHVLNRENTTGFEQWCALDCLWLHTHVDHDSGTTTGEVQLGTGHARHYLCLTFCTAPITSRKPRPSSVNEARWSLVLISSMLSYLPMHPTRPHSASLAAQPQDTFATGRWYGKQGKDAWRSPSLTAIDFQKMVCSVCSWSMELLSRCQTLLCED